MCLLEVFVIRHHDEAAVHGKPLITHRVRLLGASDPYIVLLTLQYEHDLFFSLRNGYMKPVIQVSASSPVGVKDLTGLQLQKGDH